MSQDQFENNLGIRFEQPRRTQRGISLAVNMGDTSRWIETNFPKLLTGGRERGKQVGGFTEELPLNEFINLPSMSEDLREILSQDLQVRYYEGSSGQRLLSFTSRSSSYPAYPFLTMDLGNNSISSQHFEIGEIVGYLDLMATHDSIKLCRQTIIDNLTKIGISESEIQSARNAVRTKIDEFRQLLERVRSIRKISEKKIPLPPEDKTLVVTQGEYSATGGEGKKRYIDTSVLPTVLP